MLTNVNDFIRFLSAGGQLISSAMLKPLKICIKESRIFARAYIISKRSLLTETLENPALVVATPPSASTSPARAAARA